MEQKLSELFDQARRIVADHERRQAEREAMLRSFAQTVDSAFDFTAREKAELDPRMDVMENRGVLQFIVQSYDAIFLLSEGHGRHWGLQAAQEGHPLELMTEIEGGIPGDSLSRRLAAARVIVAIGEWVARHEPTVELPATITKSEPEIETDEDIHEETFAQTEEYVSFANRDGESNGKKSRPAPPVPQFGKSFGY